jgi:hypothetical protein
MVRTPSAEAGLPSSSATRSAKKVVNDAVASELLPATVAGVHSGRQLITVTRRGTGELQQLAASTDALVWLRLYCAVTDRQVPDAAL